jgi:hypothetical protein
MPDETPKPDETPPPQADASAEDEARRLGLGELVRRAVSAGIGAAARGKEDIVRVAATEVRTWLDHMDLDAEIVKALSRMVIEIKTEIRFRATDDGKLVPEATNEAKVKGPPKG